MKTKFGFPLLAAVVISALAFTTFMPEEYPTLNIGDAAPLADVKMKDVSEKELSLNDIKKESGLLVVFSCNSCPFVVGGEESEGWEGRYNGLYSICKSVGIGMVLVNSNEAKRDGDDSFANMQARAKDKKYKSYYVMDTGSQLANAFGAKTTPHVFLFGSDMKLIYKGAIDDNVKSPKEVTSHYLQMALREVKSGKAITTSETKAVGCSIKRSK
ncbi:MAG: thioredoxin family protein [Bacteroidota bacterium]